MLKNNADKSPNVIPEQIKVLARYHISHLCMSERSRITKHYLSRLLCQLCLPCLPCLVPALPSKSSPPACLPCLPACPACLRCRVCAYVVHTICPTPSPLYLHALSALPVRLALSICLVCSLALFLCATNKLQRLHALSALPVRLAPSICLVCSLALSLRATQTNFNATAQLKGEAQNDMREWHQIVTPSHLFFG